MSKPQGPFALTDAQAVLTLRNNLKKVTADNKKPAAPLPVVAAKPATAEKPAARKLPAIAQTTADKPTAQPTPKHPVATKAAAKNVAPPVPKRDLPPLVPKRADIGLPPPVPPRRESLTEASAQEATQSTSIPLPPPPPKAPALPKTTVTAAPSAKPALLFTANDLATAKSKGLKAVAIPVENKGAKVGRVFDGSTSAVAPATPVAPTTESKARPASAPVNANGVSAGFSLNDELLAKLNRRKTTI